MSTEAKEVEPNPVTAATTASTPHVIDAVAEPSLITKTYNDYGTERRLPNGNMGLFYNTLTVHGQTYHLYKSATVARISAA